MLFPALRVLINLYVVLLRRISFNPNEGFLGLLNEELSCPDKACAYDD